MPSSGVANAPTENLWGQGRRAACSFSLYGAKA